MFTSDLEIIRIGEGVRDRTLPKRDWTHPAHIAAAVWVLNLYGDRSDDILPELIRAYNVATGVQNTDQEGYHHTITLASLRAVRAIVSGLDGPLSAQTNTVLTAGYDRPDWLMRHYTKACLFSVQARRAWVEPDLDPLP
jgi:hypothetical protein